MLTVFFYINFVIVIINTTSTVDSKPAGDSLLWTPRHADKSQSPETHKEMTEINSCYYGPSLLRKCGNFHTAPPPPLYQRTSFHLFFSHLSGHLSTSSNIHYFIFLEKNNLLFSRTPLLWTYAITDINLPPLRASIITGVDCIITILLFL